MKSVSKTTLSGLPGNYLMDKVEKRMTPNQLNKATGAFIRQKRLELGLNGSELGRLLNISQQQISRYERGATSFTLHQLESFLRALSVSWASFTQEVLLPLSSESNGGVAGETAIMRWRTKTIFL